MDTLTNLLHPWVVALALLAALVVAVVLARRWRSAEAVPLAHTDRLERLPAYVRARRTERLLTGARLGFAGLAVVGAALVVARPSDTTTVEPDSRSRDVVLCLDVSSSMTTTDAALVETFGRVTESSPGQRTGLVLFASRPVQVFPLTDDAEFVRRQLDVVRDAYATGTTGSAGWAGTTGGNGTSVIGDGVATCLTAFDRLDTPRPRSVLLATDNVVSGAESVTFAQAGVLAADRGIRIYGLNPADPDGTSTRPAAQQFRTVTEQTGGGYFPVSDPGTVDDVVAAVAQQEEARFTGAPRVVRTDDPRAAAVVAGVGVLGSVVLGLLVETRRRRVWTTGAVLLVLVGVVAARPSVPGGTAAVQSRDVDVWFVVDGTLSMVAEDYGAGSPRLDGVRADVAALTERFAGARFATIVSGSSAVQTMPLTTDTAAARTSVDAMTPSSLDSGAGSDPRNVAAVLQRALGDGAVAAPGRAQLVFYFGDGEVTSGSPSSPLRADGLSGGAVLGYGTTQGGRMQAPGVFAGEAEGYVQDVRPGLEGDAVSHADPATLQAMADELGVPYVARSAGDPIDAALVDARPGELRPAGDDASARTSTAWPLGIALLGLLVVDGVHWFRRRRA